MGQKILPWPLIQQREHKDKAKGSHEGERKPSRTSGSEGPTGNQQGAEQPDEGITDRATALSEVSGATMMGRCMAVGMGSTSPLLQVVWSGTSPYQSPGIPEK